MDEKKLGKNNKKRILIIFLILVLVLSISYAEDINESINHTNLNEDNNQEEVNPLLLIFLIFLSIMVLLYFIPKKKTFNR